MKEDFLHHVWQFKKFNQLNLNTVQGEALQVIHPGQYLQLAGPDFFNAQIIVGKQKWAGNVEIHLKSSDCYLHNHETDPNYDSVILYVVWEYDTEVLRKDGSEIPVLVLKNQVDSVLVANYNVLAAAKTWINCEKELAGLEAFTVNNWKERLFLERLERKALPIMQLANNLGGDWEAVLCCFLAKNFGLNTNGPSFFEVVKSLPFSVIRKESFEPENIEALLFGRAGLLAGDFEDLYARDLQQRYAYIMHKHRLENEYVTPVEFFRHRPDNFPTIRLSQFGQLYHSRQNLFSKVIETSDLKAVYDVFDVQAAPYWATHYRFDKESPKKRKALSKSFMDLLIINTIVPFKFAYAKATGKEITEELLALMQLLAPENNTVMDKFKHFKMPVENAYDSQALLQLKNEYCNHKRCMQCAIGLEILKR
ncbi:hypothetical protein AM493_18850 [Flavobacterium akiainvivens]|uniref:DUF2851 domain-containing protein n=1 Tax=Flavobacterium akiainvivens TaxID=1202724 RepID=A0A0M8MLB3_9FLAO|nr:DUF2851 family protein [Flavobacterium akiainvivens]KOS07888.1 hypothetical protein AM493_18850 [Flavobacterium akiainvivens]SFQ28165.1 Protein of unknown function [Flavobacterium akiainvivens]